MKNKYDFFNKMKNEDDFNEDYLSDTETKKIVDRISSKTKKYNKTSKKTLAIIAASIAGCIFIGFTPPVNAAINKFVFGFGKENPGVLIAEDKNFYQSVDGVSLSTDKVDIKLNSLMIDQSRIILNYQMTFKDDNIDFNDKKSYDFFVAEFSLYDQSGNVIAKNGVAGPIGSLSSDYDIVSADGKTINYTQMFSSSKANIPVTDVLNIVLDNITMIKGGYINWIDDVLLNENINWNASVQIDSRLKDYKSLAYKWKDSDHITVSKAIALPTGIALEFVYDRENRGFVSGGNKDYMYDNPIIVTEDGKEYPIDEMSDGWLVDEEEKGDRYYVVFNAVTSFEEIDKFKLEFKNVDGKLIDTVEFEK